MKLHSFFRRTVLLLLVFSLALSTLVFAMAESKTMIVTQSALTVYSSQELITSIGTLNRYAVVTLVSENNGIARISQSGKTGYVDAAGLESPEALSESAYINAKTYVYAKPSASAKKVSVSANMRVNLIAVSGSWAMIERNGTIGYVNSRYVTRGVPASVSPTSTVSVTYEEFNATITVSSVTVYASPSTGAKKLGTLKKNAQVTVHAYDSTWAYISQGNKYGYCKKSALKLVEAPSVTVTPAPLYGLVDGVEVDFSAAVNASSLKVYAGPSTNNKSLGTIKKGTVVTVYAYNKTWAYVELNGNYGYCQHKYLTKVASPTSTPATTPTPAVSPSPTISPTPLPIQTPTATPPTSSDPIFSNSALSNEQKLYHYFTKEAGYSTAVACGLLANISAESNFRPNAGTTYKGLCQWSSSRFSGLITWCEGKGLDPYSLEGQAKYLVYDLKNRYPVYYKALCAMENTAQGAYEAGYYFCYYYERPSNKESRSVTRGNAAKGTYWPKYAQ